MSIYIYIYIYIYIFKQVIQNTYKLLDGFELDASVSSANYSMNNGLLKCGIHCSKDQNCILTMIKKNICYLFNRSILNPLPLLSQLDERNTLLMLKYIDG